MKNLKFDDSKAYEVFQKEYDFYVKARKVLNNKNISKKELFKEYKSFLEIYLKLLSQITKMVKIGDSTQNKLMIANVQLKEKENEIQNLLKETLSGSIKLLKEVLSIVSPVAIEEALRLKGYIIRIVDYMGLEDKWIYEISSIFCFAGYISLNRSDIDLVHKSNIKDLTEYNNHPIVGYKLISCLPRLEVIANIVRNQNKPFVDYPYKKDLRDYEPADLGAQIIKAGIDYCDLIDKNYSHIGAIAQMSKKLNLYHPQMLDIIKKALES